MRNIIVVAVALILLLLPIGGRAATINEELEYLASNIANAFSPRSSLEERRNGVRAIMAGLPLPLLSRIAFGRTLKKQNGCVQDNPEGALREYLTGDRVVNHFADTSVESYEMRKLRKTSESSWLIITAITERNIASDRKTLPRSYRWTVQYIEGKLRITNLVANGIDLRSYLTSYVRTNTLPCPNTEE